MHLNALNAFLLQKAQGLLLFLPHLNQPNLKLHRGPYPLLLN
jgi:hypothetical protein